MSELVATDTSGKQHFIWLQEKSDTCGPSGDYMIQTIISQACCVNGEAAITDILKFFPQGYKEGQGTLSMKPLADALNQMGFPAQFDFINDFKSYIINAKLPLIARIQWPDGGGHFIVCAERSATDNTIICYDPYYGLVQPSIDTVPSYTVSRNYRDSHSFLDGLVEFFIPKVVAGGRFSGHIVSLT